MITLMQRFYRNALCASLTFAPLLAETVAVPQAPASHAAPTKAPGGNMPPLSPEDVKFFEEVEQQINSYVASLPPAEQKKFWEDVATETEKISKMNEHELMDYLENIEKSLVQEPLPAAQKPMPAPQPTPSYVPEIKVEEKPQPVQPIDKQQTAIKLIDTALKHIQNFMRKAQAMVELPGKIRAWRTEGKLKDWPDSLTWEAFKSNVEEFAQKLSKLKDRDPKTNLYKYLDDFIKSEGLYNNVSKLSDTLSKREPLIVINDFGIEKMSSESRQAIRDVIIALREAQTLLGIPQAFDKIFEQYEPTAKKLKETEEGYQKAAYESSKVSRTTSPATVGGTAKERQAERTNQYDYYGGGRGGDQYHYYSPAYDYPYDRGGNKGTEEPIKAKQPSAGTTKKEAEKSGGAAKPADKKREESKDASDIAKNFDDALFEFQDLVEHTKNLDKFESYMKGNAPIDTKLLDAIPKATGALSKAIRHAKRMKRLIAEDYPEAQKKEFRNKIKKGYQDYKFLLEKIAADIYNVENRLTLYTQMPAAAPGAPAPAVPDKAKKAWAYFGAGNILTTIDPAIPAAVTMPVQDMHELREHIIELRKLVNEL